ncbi:MAG: hypothetical protein CL789_03715 [Chloroflexi bacterium]|nr:hypothetical protein [Chloroflexota bacterium]HCU80136.1 hypothetical protein [Chloroflexota bacterium]
MSTSTSLQTINVIGTMRDIRPSIYITFILACIPFMLIGCEQEAKMNTSQPDNVNTLTPNNTSSPPTISPTFTLISPKKPCTNDAMFVTDLTIPDFTKLEPDKPISKLWQIRNTGTCSWGPGYSVVFKEGHAMTAKLQHALYPAQPDANAIIQIDMTTPSSPGDYQGYWLLYDPDGIMFGHKLFIKITVEDTIETSSSE